MNKERLKFIIMVVLLPLAGICGLLAFNQKNASWLTREKYRKYKAERRAAPVTNTAKAAFVPPPTPIAEPTSSPVAAQWTASTVQTPSGTPYPYEQRTTDDGQTLYRLTTLPFSDGIMGYAGPIPMRIIVDQKRKLHQVEFLENSESPAYFARVTNWAQRLIGHAVPGQAQNHQIDALTGATYSSDAIRQSLTQTCNRFFELIESPEAAAAQPTPQPTLSTPYSRLPGTPRNIDQKRIRTLIENNELSDQPAAFAVPTDP
jgi:electron transport complex protein RnfG